MSNLATTLALAAIASSASAFWGAGHLLIARRAQAILAENAPNALQAALDELTFLRESQPSLVTEEGNNPFTECATFADDIKGKGMSWQSDWHFIDQPYYDQGGDASDYPDFHMSETDVLDALTDLTAFLKGEDTTGSVYVQTIQDNFADHNDQRSFALRMIIHYVGDIHQPLHSTSAVDDVFTEGDRGGNDEWITPSVDGVSNLHSIWDSVIYQYTGFPELPLSDDDWDWYSTEATSLSQTYPVSSSKLHEQDFQQWADESLELSQSTVYKDLTISKQSSSYIDYNEPDQAYKDKALPICQERLMYGGARLAALIEDIYGDNSINSFVDQVLSFMQ